MKPLDHKWFESQWTLVKNRAGKRYTPDLDVSLPIYEFFEAIGQDPTFFDRLEVLVSTLQKHIRDFSVDTLARNSSQEKAANLAKQLTRSAARVLPLTALRAKAPIQFPSEAIVKVLGETAQSIESLIPEVRTSGEKQEGVDKSRNEYLLQNLREIRGQLFKCEELIGGPLGAAFNDGNILVLGPAGTGKTHL